RDDGVKCYDINTRAAGLTLSTLQGYGQISLHLERLDLAPGHYYVDVGVHEREWAYAYDFHWRVYALNVNAHGAGEGILRAPHHWEIKETYSSTNAQTAINAQD
ncbi:MAG: Wzt carbohydrate-binding domain-containing protein, partial [Chloroflexota bacterium]